MDKIKLAELIATGAHYGQVDKGGSPYIGHPAAVASLVFTNEEKITAWLHDVVEDTDITCNDLYPLFGGEITDAIDAVTRRKGEDRQVYLNRVKANSIARKVKIADLTHNSDLSRIKNRELTDKDFERRKRYLREMQYLEE